MQKNIDQMNDHELLMELVKGERKSDTVIMIAACSAVILCVIFIVGYFTFVPKIIELMEQTNDTLDNLQNLIRSGDEMIAGMNKVDYDKLSEAVDQLSESIAAFSKITSIFH